LLDVEKPPFEVHETGYVLAWFILVIMLTFFARWGEFEVQIKITFSVESGEKAIAFYHHLKLHPWNVDPVDPDVPEHPPSLQAAAAFGPVNSWQYDEVVFVDPFQAFLSILTQNPPTPLPRISSRPVPFHLANPTRAALEASKGGVPEFSQQMEREEAGRLDEALKAVLEEQERWKAILDEREREVEELKAQLGEE
jgi:YEATS domain-containing protein 4